MPRLGLKWFPILRRHLWKCLTAVFLLIVAGAATGVYSYRTYHLSAARAALREEEYGDARTHVLAALRVWSGDADAQLLAARIERLNGDYIQAEKHLTEYRRIQAGPTAESQVEWLLLRAENNELEEVAPTLLYAVDQDHPRKLEMLEALARASMHQMRFRHALEYLDRWLGFEPNNARALDWRSWVYEHLNQREMAATDAERALQLQPDRFRLRLRLIDLYLDRHKTREALPHAELLAAARPDDPDALTALARCRLPLGETAEGRQLLERALALNPDHAAALRELASVYNRIDRPGDAMRLALQGLKQSPDDGELLYVLCESFRLQGIEDAETARWTARRDQVRADVELTDNFLRHQAESTARTAEQTAAAGAALLRLHQDRLGLHWLHDALKQDPTNKTANLSLADYYEKQGDAAVALEHRQAARAGGSALGAAAGCPVAAAPRAK